MREIELKFQIKEKENLLKKLKELDIHLGEMESQEDTIYVENKNDTESKEGSIWIRIRKKNDKIELNLKKQSAKKMESKEIEFGVDSLEKADDFLKTLGLQVWVQVKKKRQFAKYKNYNLCLDEVEKLGTFLEIELLVEENDNQDYEDQLLQIAKELGIPKQDRINSHYDTMIAELKNKVQE